MKLNLGYHYIASCQLVQLACALCTGIIITATTATAVTRAKTIATGIRKDAWANANRIKVEEDKPDKEQGYYLYPELYNQPEEKSIISRMLFPKEQEVVKQELLPQKK